MERRMNGDYYSPLDQYPIGIESSPSKSFPVVSSPSPSSSSSSLAVGATGGGGGGGLSYIVHQVSKFDTLAGVAIKYGVEVADIKRINGLVTDHQMFALKTLQIPLPGRHPPSPVLANGSDSQGPSSRERTPPARRHSDLFDSFESLKLKPSPQRKVSPAMSSLQGYYGLKPTDQKVSSEGFEMAVYRNGGANYLEDGPLAKPSANSNPPLNRHRKSKSVANGLVSKKGDLVNPEAKDNDSDNWTDKLLRRRQKSEVDLTARAPEMLLKEDNSSGGLFSALAVKGLALRPKAANRAVSGTDGETAWVNGGPTGVADSAIAESSNGVRKSSSTSSLQDSDNSPSSSSIWSTSKWSLKQDLQTFSAAAIARPIFDGLPKPISGRKSKAALD